MANLGQIIRRFTGTDLLHPRAWYDGNDADKSIVKQMNIPITDTQFEVPVFALKTFLDAVKGPHYANSIDSIIVNLCRATRKSSYKTLDSVLRETLLVDFKQAHLIEVHLKPQEPIYYVTHGTIFNANFHPIMMYSWLMDKQYEDEEHFKYKFIRPILRIDPGVFRNKTDSVQRYIAGKLITSSLDITTLFPEYRLYSECLVYDKCIGEYPGLTIKVEIDKSPFMVYETDKPSFSTTNEELLKLVQNHLDEILQ